ncbi:MAG: ABC transporter ATP-binding protein [Bacteroidetes bacterium]|nr:MAG: ABC transporter ATP-binding protein [Bacteroidota bacterium]
MKLFFRILRFAQPYTLDAISFMIIAFLSNLFGIINFGLLIYLLDVLFNNLTEAKLQAMLATPKWYDVGQQFNHYFALIIKNHGKFVALQFVCLQVFLSVLLTNVCYYLSMLVRERIKNRVLRNARRAIFGKIMNLHLGYFSNQRKGDLMNRASSDVGEMESTTVFALDLFVREPLAVFLFLGALLWISWQMTLFTLLIVPIMAGMIALVSRRLRKQSNNMHHLGGLLNSTLEETLGALRVIKSYNAGKYISQKFDKDNLAYLRQARSIARTRELASPFSEIAGVGLIVIILLYGGSLILSDQSTLSASEFITYLIILSQFLRPIKAISNALSNIQRGLAAGERIFEVLDLPSDVTDKPNAKVLQTFEKRIEFRNVWFKYEDAWILQDVSFVIEKGTTVALVGASGSGKSTIADLLCRFYDVQKGAILIDDVDIRDVTQESLRDMMGIVTQEYILFNDTVYNNIAFAETNATQEQVEKAARIANAHDFIIQKEEGYQTNVGDKGTKLSGGQKQRISIARAVFKNPPILLLDEATSSLDTEVEKAVQLALNNLMENRTSLIIAHRLSTIQHAHQIIVLNKGVIVERGTHEQLIQIEGGTYQNLNKMQALAV